MTDVAGLIREARLPEKVVHICLRPDLVAPYETLSEELAEQKKPGDSMAAIPDLSEKRAALAELEEQMRAATVPFVLRALPRLRFRALMAEHPPRKDPQGNPVQQDWNGVNQSTYFDALIRECTVKPTLDSETWTLLLEERLSDRQYQELSDAAWEVSRDKIDFPFLLNA